MLNIKILIKLFVLSCMWTCCDYGDTIHAEVVLCLLFALYTSLKIATISGRNM